MEFTWPEQLLEPEQVVAAQGMFEDALGGIT